jgi:hypothetical protein
LKIPVAPAAAPEAPAVKLTAARAVAPALARASSQVVVPTICFMLDLHTEA